MCMMTKCLSKNISSKRANAVNIEDSNLLLMHQCLLVGHETKSGRWWSACQCQRPDKDVPLPLYKSLHPCCRRVNLGLFTSGWTSGQKAICQRLICIRAISSVKRRRLTTPSAYSPGVCRVRCGYMGSMGRYRSSWLHTTAGLLAGNGSLTGWVNSKLSFQRTPDTQAMLGIFMTEPLCNWTTAPTANSRCDTFPPCFSLTTSATGLLFYYFLSACTWKKCMF